MTHRLSQVLTSVLLLSGSLNAMAENMKFGYVNAARVYSESQTAQQIEQNLQKEFANQQQKINALQQENNQIREKLVSGSLKKMTQNLYPRNHQ